MSRSSDVKIVSGLNTQGNGAVGETNFGTATPRSPKILKQNSFQSPNEVALPEEQWLDIIKKLIKDKRDHESSKDAIAAQFGATYALGFIHYNNSVRRFCRSIASSKWFDNFILIVIFLNCMAMAAQDVVTKGRGQSPRNEILDKIEYFFLIVFTIEMVVKIISRGFVRCRGTYLRDGWNILDFVIVVMAYVEVILMKVSDEEVPNIKILRALRVLRALKVVQSVQSLQQVLESIVSAVPQLNNVAKLIVVIVIIFAIVGVELFAGTLSSECYYNETNLPVDGRRCATDLTFIKQGAYLCPMGQYCKSIVPECYFNATQRPVSGTGGGDRCSTDPEHYKEGDVVCGDGEYCLSADVQPPNDGIMSFDNIGISILTVFQMITLEGWTDVWYAINDSIGGTWTWVYFIALTVLGSFFILNLVLGVLEGQFAKAGLRIKFRNKMKRKKMRKEITVKKESVEQYKSWMERSEDADFLVSVAKSGGSPVKRRGSSGGLENDALGPLGGDEIPEMVVLDEQDDTVKPPPRSEWGESVVHSNTFIGLIMFLVLANTCLMASEYAGQPEYWTAVLRWCNIGFVIVFTFELIFKLWALGSKLMWRYRFNRYDAFVVAISVIELVIVEVGNVSSLGLPVFRAVRLLRMLRYTSYWTPLRALVSRLTDRMGVIMSLLVIVQLMILIFALLGMQLFGGRLEGRATFDAFGWAYMSVFQVLTGENWNEVMNSAIVGSGGVDSLKGGFAALYFVILIVVGDFVILNVFLAIAVDCLDVVLDAIDDQRGDDEEEARRRKREVRRAAMLLKQNNGTLGDSGVKIDDDVLAVAASSSEKDIPPASSFFIFSATSGFRVWCNNTRNHRFFDPFILICIAISSICLAIEDPLDLNSSLNGILNYFDQVFLAIFGVEMIIKWIALGLVGHKGAYMRDVWNLIDMTAVIASLIAVILTEIGVGGGGASAIRVLRVIRVLRPLRSVKRIPELQKIVQSMIEAVANITPVVILLVVSLFLFGVIGVSIFKDSFGHCDDSIVEDFRFLDLSNCTGTYDVHDDGLNETFTYEHTIVKEYLNFDHAGIAMLTLFASSTTEGWMGTVYNLIDSTGPQSSMDGSNRTMYTHNTIVEDNRPGVTAFLIVFMIIVSMFMLNLFIGFVIVTYQAASEEEFEDCILDKGDRECVAYVLKATPLKIWKPEVGAGKIRSWCYDVAVSSWFDSLVTFMIVLNLVVLMMKYEGMPNSYADILDTMNVVFTAVFIVEAIVKIIGLSVRGYFSNRWNFFDFFIVITSIIDVVLTFAGVDFAILRLFRSMRLIKLLKSGETETLLNTFFRSFSELPYVVLLVMLVFFIYAVVGMQIFGRVAESLVYMCADGETVGCGPYYVNGTLMEGNGTLEALYLEGSSIDGHANFTSLWKALALLFRSATGENWQDLMRDLDRKDPEAGECTEFPIDGESHTCGGSFAIFYMLSFVLLGSFIVLNLFVAVIVDNFAFLTQDSAELGANGLEEFSQMWSKYDPQGTMEITLTQLNDLLMELQPPFGLKGCPTFILRQKLSQVRCPIGVRIGTGTSAIPEAFTVQFRSVFMGLVRLQKGGINEEKGGSWKDMDDQELKDVILTYVSQDKEKLEEAIPSHPPDHTCTIKSLRSYYHVLRLQKWWRDVVRKRRKAAGLGDFADEDAVQSKHSIMRFTDRRASGLSSPSKSPQKGTDGDSSSRPIEFEMNM